MEEVPLGGNLSASVRIGDTVHRRAGSWTPAVHALLAHLQRVGFGAAPEPLGMDEQGRAVQSFIPGEVHGGWPDPLPRWMFEDEATRRSRGLGCFPCTRRCSRAAWPSWVPNIHGSTGYGQSWQTAIHKDWGGIDLRDLTAIADWMAAQPDFDRARLAVHGGSYGGFAALMCVTRLPDRWRCGVDVCGWADLVLALQTKEPNWKRFMERWVGKLPEDEKKLRLRSPITYIHNVRCPMLILQGEKDTRVAKVASDQVVEGFRAAGSPVEYVVYPDEGHGFTKKENADDAQERVLAFLTKHLLEGES